MEFQSGWRWCLKCACLVLEPNGGRCTDGSDHNLWRVMNIQVAHGTSEPDWQDQWALCWKCGCLVHWRFNEGMCYDGQPHDRRSSNSYLVQLEGSTPPSTWEDSLWCSRCQRLFWLRDYPSRCSDESPHIRSDSGRYRALYVLEEENQHPDPGPPPEVPIGDPKLEIFENSNQIVVTGTRFTPGSGVILEFHNGSLLKRVNLGTGPDGAFEHTVLPTVRAKHPIQITALDTARGFTAAVDAVKRMPPELQPSVSIDGGSVRRER